MIKLSKSRIKSIKETKYVVYSNKPLHDGCECFSSVNELDNKNKYVITSVPITNIKYENGRFFYTTEDLSTYADWFPAAIMNTKGKFSPCTKVKSNAGKVIKSNKCIVDVSGLPAFSCLANEDISISEYRFYLTLFNKFTVKECQYERHDLYDAVFNSSKYDLVSKVQNSDFLKSKDFKMINYKRKEEETVQVGIIIKESNDAAYNGEYGNVFIDMNNKISIIWH